MKFRKISIIGAGTMGPGIAEVCARSGLDVTLVDIKGEIISRAFKRIRADFDTLIEMDWITKEEAEKAISRIKGTNSLIEALADADFVIEAIPENIDAKKNLFKELDELTPEHVILSSNTSSLSITEISLSMKRPDRFVGLHYFTPPHILRPVEIVRGEKTSDETVNLTKELVKRQGKIPIVCKDSPGFVINRILMAMFVETASILEEGLVESPHELDLAVRFAIGVRLPFFGPFQIADLGGLDIWLATARNLYERLGHPKFKPPKMLIEKVASQELGVKTKKGFYQYQDELGESLIRKRDVCLLEILKLIDEKGNK